MPGREVTASSEIGKPKYTKKIPGKVNVLPELPNCPFCVRRAEYTPDKEINKARYDFKVKNTDTWVYGCEYHWLFYGENEKLGKLNYYLISKEECKEDG